MNPQGKKSFVEAGAEKEMGLVQEFFLMLRENKKYWQVPLLLMLMGLSALVVLGGTAAAPFIYTIF